MWDEITHSFPNFNGGIVEDWERISDTITHFIGHVIRYPCLDYLLMLESKLIHISKLTIRSMLKNVFYFREDHS